MSWDIFVQDFPRDAARLEDIPDDFKPRSIGKRSELIGRIQEGIPAADFTDPSWGTIDCDGWSIEVNIGDEEDCGGIAFHVRGGALAAGVVDAILHRLDLRAVDSQTGTFYVAGSEAVNSFNKWRLYRDQVVTGTRGT